MPIANGIAQLLILLKKLLQKNYRLLKSCLQQLYLNKIMTQLLHLVFVLTLAAYLVMMNFCAKVMNSKVKVMNSISNGTNSFANRKNSFANRKNSFANGTKSIAKRTNSIAQTCKSLRALLSIHFL